MCRLPDAGNSTLYSIAMGFQEAHAHDFTLVLLPLALAVALVLRLLHVYAFCMPCDSVFVHSFAVAVAEYNG